MNVKKTLQNLAQITVWDKNLNLIYQINSGSSCLDLYILSYKKIHKFFELGEDFPLKNQGCQV